MKHHLDQKFDLDHLRSWIGREDICGGVIDLELVRKFHATFDMAGPIPAMGDKAPTLIHFCFGQPAAPTASLGEDGHPVRGGFMPPVPLPRRMWAGGSLTFRGDLHVGQAVRRISRIAEVALKQGRTGPLCFVTIEHELEADGRIVVTETQDIVYRGHEMDRSAEKLVRADGPGGGQYRRELLPTPLLLFRYSALTFNGHRIHYDRRYAREAEGYPGLVVQGPLQATLLINFASVIRGAPPSRFKFRSLAPLYDTDAMVLHANDDGGILRLWTARRDAHPAMEASASWE